MSSNRSESHGAPVSFLDVIACAFGAVILLIVILPVGMFAITPEDNDSSEQFGRLLFESGSLDEMISLLTAELERTRQLTSDLTAGLVSSAEASQKVRQAIQETRDNIDQASDRTEMLKKSADLLTASRRTTLEATEIPVQLAGIPVDSEYVAFVVDTSGSMHAFWPEVVREVEQVLDLYPDLKGFQFISDQAKYLFKGSAGKWINDSKASRKRAVRSMRRWSAFSASSPEKGISTAVRTLYRDGIKMAIFVIGDDYNGREFDSFLKRIDSVVKLRNVHSGALRIHAIGFYEPAMSSPWNFSTLMRELTRQHRGVFLGLELKGTMSPFPAGWGR